MIYGKLWCVVKPSVGLPLFLGGVALTSLTVHFAVLNNTSWFKGFMEGPAKVAAVSADASSPPPEAPAAKK
jgi:light-harvesting protein B-800-850 alpha chain